MWRASLPIPHAVTSFSFWTLFLQADWVIKAIILILILCSILSWTLILSKIYLLWSRQQSADLILSSFQTRGEPLDASVRAQDNVFLDMMILMDKEASRMVNQSTLEARQWSAFRFEQRLELLVEKEHEEISQHMGILASIGSLSPFIGLLGTVWGIMNCFQAIGASKNASLAVVGPGIAEALFTTAIGLVVAIVAVLFHNFFTDKIDLYTSRMENFLRELVLAAGSTK